MGFNSADFLPLIIEKVNPTISKIYEESPTFIKRIQKGSKQKTNNRGVRLVSRVRPNPNMMWYDSDNGQLPPDGKPQFLDMRVFFANYIIAGGLTKKVLALNDDDALVDIVTNQMDGDMETLLKQLEVQSWNSGDAAIGVVSSVSGSDITMTAPYGGTRFLLGGTYNFYAPGSTTPRNGGSITNAVVDSIVQSTGVVSFTTSGVPNDIQAGDIVTLRGSYQRAIHGVKYHVNNDSGDYQGQSRGTYPELKSTVFDANSARISVAILDKTIALNEIKMGMNVKANDFTLWSSQTQYELYRQLGYSFIRFQGNGNSGGGKFNGTYAEGIQHGQIVWEKAIDAPDDRIYGIRMMDMEWYELEAMQVLKDDSLTMRLIPDVSGTAGAFRAGFVYYIGGSGEIGCKDPRKHFAITNLSTSNGPTRMAA